MDQSFGQVGPTESSSEYNALATFIRKFINNINVATLVQVTALRDASSQPDSSPGQLQAAGFVDVTPLVNMLDGQGNSFPHGTVHNLPYLRLQGGPNAVICDPEVGDVGLAVFCDRDISSVKQNAGQSDPHSNPGSLRRNSLSDGVYLGRLLGKQPTQFLQFRDSDPKGITLQDTVGNTVIFNPTPPEVTLKAADGNRLEFSSTAPNVLLEDTNGNQVVTAPTGIVVTDVFKNTVTLSAAGIVLKDLSGNTVTFAAGGWTLTDDKGNSVATSSSGIKITGNVEITGTLTVDGAVQGKAAVYADFGAAGQVGLLTHDHSGVTTGTGNTGAPVPGT